MLDADNWRRLWLWLRPWKRSATEWERYMAGMNRIRSIRDQIALRRLEEERRAR